MNIQVIASGSKGNCYIVSDGKTKVLLDAGIPFRDIYLACNFNTTSIDGVLITHEHKDHCRAVKELLMRGVKVYTAEGTKRALHEVLDQIHIVKALKKFKVGTFEVLPFDVEHDAAEPLGFLLISSETHESLLYFTDTYYIKYSFMGVNYIMGECNYSAEIAKERIANGELAEAQYKRLVRSHMSIETFIDFLKASDTSKVKQIYLLHMSDGNGNEAEFKKRVQEITGTEVYVC